MDGHLPLYALILALYIVGIAWLCATVGLAGFLAVDYWRDRRRSLSP